MHRVLQELPLQVVIGLHGPRYDHQARRVHVEPVHEKRIVPRVTVAYSRQLGNYFRLGLKADAGVAVDVSDFAGEMMSRRISPRGGIGACLDFFSSECATTGVVVGYDLTSVKYTFGHSTPVDVSKMVSSIEIGFRTLWRF